MKKDYCDLCATEIERRDIVEMDLFFHEQKRVTCTRYSICKKCKSKVLDLLNNNKVFEVEE